jgi:hypothetical protein
MCVGRSMQTEVARMQSTVAMEVLCSLCLSVSMRSWVWCENKRHQTRFKTIKGSARQEQPTYDTHQLIVQTEVRNPMYVLQLVAVCHCHVAATWDEIHLGQTTHSGARAKATERRQLPVRRQFATTNPIG